MTRRTRSRPAAFLVLIALLAVLLNPAVAEGASGPRHASRRRVLAGTVSADGVAARGFTVTAWRASARGTRRLAHASADRRGRFVLRLPPDISGPLYLTAHPHGEPALTLLTVLTSARPRTARIDERTTVAGAFAAAQFLRGTAIVGPSPSVPDAFATAANLIDPSTGAIAAVLGAPPNGSQTTTLATLDTLADAVSACFTSADRGCRRLRSLAGRATDVVDALASIARAPARNAARIAALPSRATFKPRLQSAPKAWTLSLLYTGGGLDGPGRIAFDSRDHAWVTNNFTGPSTQPGLGLTALGPTGRPIDHSPVEGGGLQGAWWGLAVDQRGDVWVSSFVGADSEPSFTDPTFQGGDTVSEFSPAGTVLSPPDGYHEGGLRAPQGIAIDQFGNVWIADHGSNAVTEYLAGNPARARTITGGGLYKPFALQADARGDIWVDNGALGQLPGSLTRIDQEGTPTGPIADGMSSPQGLAIDREGDVWVAQFGGHSVVRVTPAAPPSPLPSPGGTDTTVYAAGSLLGPWGVAVDGNDNVWVTSFLRGALTELCGTARRGCPSGTRTGSVLSPPHGFSNGGLQHVTGVQVDESGNVWLANNWSSLAPIKGGDSVVEFVGLAGPVETPLIGPPRSP